MLGCLELDRGQWMFEVRFATEGQHLHGAFENDRSVLGLMVYLEREGHPFAIGQSAI